MYGPTLQENEKQLDDLAYIKIMAAGYSDDADSESEGVAIDVVYYDSKSEPIDFTNVPMNVVIELYGYHDISDTFDQDKMELVHKESITIDHSMRLGEMFGKYIRIPFDDISVDSKEYYEYGTIKVTVEMLGKGKFSDETDLVPLYKVTV
ncbi:MAG: hypothetical protein PHD13_03795 [Methanocellales archaeon]|nr:hypothetical protein [Methanocellales archaeon]MDD3291179.1 hypothetical protein [Methanocellales archaeon]MDD5235279.1 hypothetical protein [Methanocellales archaeon]MDD5484565.1 hypothetical protein [Methanocellales archaeon]